MAVTAGRGWNAMSSLKSWLAAGAPVAAHWHADRQVAPLLLRYGSESLRAEFLPKIARGECFIAIGMSEPGAGSDLAAVRTQAKEAPDGRFVIRGQKIWASHAHRSDYMIALVRTDPPSDRRRDGLSQILIDLRAPGVDIRPIRLLNGETHFAEVFFDDVDVSHDMLVGLRGNGWSQVTSELAFERSGPERILTTFPLLLNALLEELGPTEDQQHVAMEVGRIVAHTLALRRLARAVATDLDAGHAQLTRLLLSNAPGRDTSRKWSN